MTTTFLICVEPKDGEALLFHFTCEEFGVANALMQVLSVQQNEDDVIFYVTSGIDRYRIATKADIQDAMKQQRLAQMQGGPRFSM